MEDLEKEVKLQEEMMKSGEDSSKVANIIHEKRVNYAKKRELKLREFKKTIVSLALPVTFIAGSIAGYKISDMNKKDNKVSEYTYENNYSIDNAPDDLLVEWAYAVRNQEIPDDDIRQNCQNVIDSYISYYKLKSDDIENKVLEENNIVNPYVSEYNEYKYQIHMLEENLSTSYSYQNYSFENSLYSKSIVLDGIVYVPYKGSTDNIPDTVQIVSVNGENKLFIRSAFNYKHSIEEDNSYSK